MSFVLLDYELSSVYAQWGHQREVAVVAHLGIMMLFQIGERNGCNPVVFRGSGVYGGLGSTLTLYPGYSIQLRTCARLEGGNWWACGFDWIVCGYRRWNIRVVIGRCLRCRRMLELRCLNIAKFLWLLCRYQSITERDVDNEIFRLISDWSTLNHEKHLRFIVMSWNSTKKLRDHE